MIDVDIDMKRIRKAYEMRFWIDVGYPHAKPLVDGREDPAT